MRDPASTEPEHSEEIPRKFHWNVQLMSMVALTLLALALPITIFLVGVVQATKHPSSARQSLSHDNPGLRAVLEKVAEDKLSDGNIADERGHFTVPKSNRVGFMTFLDEKVRSLQGSLLIQGDSLTVQIPSDAANRFILDILPYARKLSEPSRNKNFVCYEIHFVDEQ